MSKSVDIEIICDDSRPYSNIVEHYRIALGAFGLRIHAGERPAGDLPDPDWLLLTAVILFLGKSYFQTLLQEAAKDHYVFFKNVFTHIIDKIMGQQPEFIKSRGMSKYFKVCSVTVTDIRIEFFLEDGYPKEFYMSCLRDAYNLMLEHYRDHPNDRLTQQISAFSKQYS